MKTLAISLVGLSADFNLPYMLIFSFLDADHDVDALIEKTETEGDESEESTAGANFSFAKIWTSEKESLEELQEDANLDQQSDAWQLALQRLAQERETERAMELTGRGVRRKAAMPIKPQVSTYALLVIDKFLLIGCSNSAKPRA